MKTNNNKELAEYIDNYIREQHQKSRTKLRINLMQSVGLLVKNEKLSNPIGQWKQFLRKRMWLEQFQALCKFLNIVIMITPSGVTLYKAIPKKGVQEQNLKEEKRE